MGFIAKEIRWYKEAVEGEKPASPANMLIQTAESYNLSGKYPTADFTPIGAGGEAAPKMEGTPNFDGDIGVALAGDIMPLILTHLIGTPTKTAVSATAWASATAYTAGTIVAHSDGIHMLYCQNDGTSGGTEPDITGLNEFDIVTDNDIKWVVRKNLFQYTGQRDDIPSSFGIEARFTDGNNDIYERYGGCRINSAKFGKSGDDIGFKTSLSIMSGNGDDSVTNASYPAQGGTDTILSKEYFDTCDLEVLIDDVQVVQTKEASVTITRNVSNTKTVQCGENITEVGVISIPGTLSCLMSVDTYRRMANRETHKLTLRYKHKGDLCELTFPKIKFDRVPLTVEAQKYVAIDGTFSAYGDSVNPSVSYTAISSVDY